MTDAFRLDDAFVHLDRDAMRRLAPAAGRPTSAAETLDRGHLVSVFAYAASWTKVERHPVGDELVHVLTGRIELRLEDEHGERAVPLATGEAAVIPAGAWHHVAVIEPCTLLFVTPTPATTEHRPTP